jgi:hypothetical protein
MALTSVGAFYMIIRKFKYSELKEYYNIALQCSLDSKIPEFEINEQHVLKTISTLANEDYFRVIEKDGKVVGWIAAGSNNVYLYNSKQCLSVLSYQCILKGKSAVNALLDVHENLYDYAEARGYELVVTNSILNSKKVFNRILSQEGWLERGSLMLRRTSHFSAANGGRRAVRPQTVTEVMGQ